MNDQSQDSRLMKLETQHTNIISALGRIENRLDNFFVSHAEFWPVRTIVYVGAGITLTGVLGAVIALVMRVA